MTQAEKNNILDQHKTIYDGFATQYGQPKEQPLYVQDFANDKNGITVSNKGDVKGYTNMNINEAYADAGFVPDETFEDKEFMVSVGEQLDMIGDGDDDFDHGTFEDDETEMLVGPEGEMEIFVDDDKDDFDDIDSMFEGIEEDKVEPLQEQINKTLDMFKRFKNF